MDKADGPLLAVVKIEKTADWKLIQSKLASVPSRIHDLVITQKGNDPVDLDWISFE